jgi:hypothetical protein
MLEVLAAVREQLPDTYAVQVRIARPSRVTVLGSYLAADEWVFARRGDGLEEIDAEGRAQAPAPATAVDVVVRLAGARELVGCRMGDIEPRVGGLPAGEACRATALALARGDRTLLTTVVWRTPDGSVSEVARARTAVDAASVHRSADAAVTPLAGMIVSVLEHGLEQPSPPVDGEDGDLPPVRVASTATRAAIELVTRRARRAVVCDRFRLAWRAGGPGGLIGGDLGGLSEIRLPTGEEWADPFILHHDGRHHVFFEHIRARETRGVISTFELGEDGQRSQPSVVLEHDTHLSYPHVFKHEDGVYMIPETEQRQSVELYRAERVPDRWVLDAVLLDGVRAVDATPFRHDGRWWMFVSVAERRESVNAQVSLYYSDSLQGPWLPHRANPVVRDVRRARPAGRVIAWDGGLIRPGQDCTTRYGSGIVLSRIVELSPSAYAEQPFARFQPSRTRGAHCFDSDGTLAVLDVIRPTRPRWLDWEAQLRSPGR